MEEKYTNLDSLLASRERKLKEKSDGNVAFPPPSGNQIPLMGPPGVAEIIHFAAALMKQIETVTKSQEAAAAINAQIANFTFSFVGTATIEYLEAKLRESNETRT